MLILSYYILEVQHRVTLRDPGSDERTLDVSAQPEPPNCPNE